MSATMCFSAAIAPCTSMFTSARASWSRDTRRLRDDVIPFGFVLHPVARLAGINVVGMRRRGASKETIRAVQQPTRCCSKARASSPSRVDAAEAKLGNVPEVAKIIAFIRAKRQRPIMLSEVRGRRSGDFD